MEHSTKTFIITFVITSMLLGFGSSDLAQDREECTSQLVAVSPCLPYVGGNAKAPTKDCCGGFGQVITKSVKCVCILIKDKDDPNLGLKFNATLAARLPTACHITAPNITECISLLHVPPNSTLAKEYESLGRIEGNSNTTSPSPNVKKDGPGGGNAEPVKSNGEKKKESWLAVELLLFALFSHLLLIISALTPSFI
uniref:Protein YLS3 n=1 Tax=Noccaea caerulescens TaxID=107243 RepID=A0A1J3DDH6_NOCCA